MKSWGEKGILLVNILFMLSFILPPANILFDIAFAIWIISLFFLFKETEKISLKIFYIMLVIAILILMLAKYLLVR